MVEERPRSQLGVACKIPLGVVEHRVVFYRPCQYICSIMYVCKNIIYSVLFCDFLDPDSVTIADRNIFLRFQSKLYTVLIKQV